MSEKNVPLIKTVALKKYFQTPRGLLHAVDGIDLSIFSGETLGVVGESGCGKSTLGRTILRLVPHTSGDIFYDGESIIRKNANEMRRMRQKMQIIFQDPYSSLDPRMTVSDLISEYMLVNHTYSTRVAVQAETKKLMDIVGLASRFADAYPHELDGGRASVSASPAHCLSIRSLSSVMSRSLHWMCPFRHRFSICLSIFKKNEA